MEFFTYYVRDIEILLLKTKIVHSRRVFCKDKNIKTCILTSKDIFRSKVFLKKFDIKVNKLITPEKIKFPKPHPFALNQLKKIYRIHYSNILFIGDTIHDYKCAKSAKVNYAHVNWGYGKNYKPKIKINNFLDLNKYFIF